VKAFVKGITTLISDISRTIERFGVEQFVGSASIFNVAPQRNLDNIERYMVIDRHLTIQK